MMTSEASSETPSNKFKPIPAWLIWSFVIVSFIGFVDSTYLAVMHYSGTLLNCGGLGDCNAVLTSKYSEFFGIPTSLGGVFFYLTVFLTSLLYINTKNQKILSLIPLLTIIGLMVSICLVYLQLFVIHEICPYCMFSAGTSTILFVLGMILLKKRKKLHLSAEL